MVDDIYSPLVDWLALWLCDPQFAGSNPVGDVQSYDLTGGAALKNRRTLFINETIVNA